MTIYRGNIAEDEQNEAIRELGERLKNIREAQNLSIDEISVITRIQKRYLQAIEAGELSALPKGPYVRGFIRQYCEFLSAADMWNTYDMLTAAPARQTSAETFENEQDYIAPPRIFKASSYWWIYIIVIISLAAAGWITWSYRGEITGISTSPISGGTASASRDRSEARNASGDAAVSADVAASESQAVSADLGWMDGRSETKPAPASQTAQTGGTAATEAGANARVPSGKNVLRIAATGSCWLRISSGEQILYTGTLRPGESKTLTVSDRPVRVKYGNPGGVSVTWGGSAVSPLGSGTRPMTITYRPDGAVSND